MKNSSSANIKEEVYGRETLSKIPQDGCFFCTAAEAALTQRLHSHNCPSIWHATFSVWPPMSRHSHSTPSHRWSTHSPAFSLLRDRKVPTLRNEAPVREASLTAKIPLCDSNSRNVAVPVRFTWKNNSCEYIHINIYIYIWISVLHCPFPPTPPLQASGSPGFDYGDLFIVLMEKSSYGNDLWSWMIWSGLNWFRG